MIKQIIITLGVGALIGYTVAWYTVDPEIKTEVRTVTVRDTTTRTDEKRRIERKPDGSSVTTIERTVRQDSKVKEDVTLKPVLSHKKDWSVGAYVAQDVYLLTVDRRILGDFSVGIYGRYAPVRMDAEIGVGLRYSF